MSLYWSGAVQQPGPVTSVWPEQNTIAGVIEHSAEGGRAGMYERLHSGDVSWHFSVYKDGSCDQHYPLTASCWHAGSHAQNNRLIGVEHEGIKGEPLTEAQIAKSVELTRWIAQQGHWEGLQRGVRLFEHREVYPATTCPNGRIPWDRYTEEDDVITHPLSDTERVEAGRAIGHGAGAALAGTDGRLVDRIEDASTPAGYVDYRMRLKQTDEQGV